MKKALLLFLTSVLVTSIAVAQNQQLKTLHHLQGKEDMSGLTYTGYEDELGNIVRHGALTYKVDGFTMSLYYSNNVIDGNASIVYTNPKLPAYKLSCKMKYKDGQLKEIDFEEIGDYDGYHNYVLDGRRVFKCIQNEQGLPSGEFECSISFTRNGGHDESIKGRFDDSGKATGYWDISASVDKTDPNRASFGKMGSKVYYEKGYCLGTNDNSIVFGRKYLVEKSISEQELLNNGFSFDKNAIQVKYSLMSQTSSQPNMTIGNTLDMVTVNVKRMCDIVHDVLYYGRRGQNYTLFRGLYDLCPPINFNCDYKGAFENGFMKGSLITYMSSELYQKLKTDPSQFKFDSDLKKYYVVKTDGKTRLYIPLESEEEFSLYVKQQEELEKRKEEEKKRNEEEMKRRADSLQKERMSKEAITEIQKKLDGMMKDRSGYDQYPNSKQFYPIVKYSIGDAPVSCRYDLYDCEITVSVVLNVGENNRPGYYESYKTNVIVTQERTGNYRIDKDRSFVNKERVNNIWDSIASLKNDSKDLEEQLLSNKKYSSIVASYKKENVSYNIKETDPQKQYDYYTRIINVQKAYLKFLDLVNQIDNVSNEIIAAAKDESDIAKSYQNIYKSWNLSVNKNIHEEVRRLEESDYRNIQDSCLIFIELRKTITENNAKIAGYAKTASTIVKAYNTYMKGANLTWNPEPGRNQAIREIINTQNVLMTALSKPNISEIDKTVKKSKAKTWEDVKKILFQ